MHPKAGVGSHPTHDKSRAQELSIRLVAEAHHNLSLWRCSRKFGAGGYSPRKTPLLETHLLPVCRGGRLAPTCSSLPLVGHCLRGTHYGSWVAEIEVAKGLKVFVEVIDQRNSSRNV
jgi:hypothetical protein